MGSRVRVRGGGLGLGVRVRVRVRLGDVHGRHLLRRRQRKVLGVETDEPH